MSKICPTCDANVDWETFICQCGHLFVGNIVASQTAETKELDRARRYRAFKKIGILTGVCVLLMSVVAYLKGIIRLGEDTETLIIAAAPVDQIANNAGKPRPVNPESRFELFQVKAVFTGSIIGVVDGKNKEFRLNLFGIRTPKLDEELGQESKQNLEKLVLGKAVYVKLRKSREIDTTAGEVVIGNANVGLEQVRSGFAWLMRDDLSELSDVEARLYLGAETIAQNGHVGVWSGRDAVTQIAEKVDDGTNAATADPGARYELAGKPPVDPRPLITQPSARPQAILPPASNAIDVPDRTQLPGGSIVTYTKSKNTAGDIEKGRTAGSEPPVTQSSAERKFILGPRGGCYYLSASGGKTYVDRSNCN